MRRKHGLQRVSSLRHRSALTPYPKSTCLFYESRFGASLPVTQFSAAAAQSCCRKKLRTKARNRFKPAGMKNTVPYASGIISGKTVNEDLPADSQMKTVSAQRRKNTQNPIQKNAPRSPFQFIGRYFMTFALGIKEIGF